LERDTDVSSEVSIRRRMPFRAVIWRSYLGRPKTAEANKAVKNMKSINRIRIYIRAGSSLSLSLSLFLSLSLSLFANKLVRNS